MEKTLIQCGKIASSFAGRRWRLWEWANGKIDRKLSQRGQITPKSSQDIWKKIISRELCDGDYIHLKKIGVMDEGWYLSEWVPKAPGQSWIENNLFDFSPEELATVFRTPLSNHYSLPKEIRLRFLHNSLFEHAFWEWQFSSKHSLAKQGFSSKLGVYRPALNIGNEDQYALMSIVSGKEYMVDLGFPVIVSKAVYRKYIEYSKQENTVEIEGIIKIREQNASDIFSNYMKTAGSNCNEPFENLVINSTSIPNIVGELISPLDFTAKTNGSSPIMTIRVDGFNAEEHTMNDIPAISRFSVVNPTRKYFQNTQPGPKWDKERFSLDFLLDDDPQFDTTMSPATDFDGKVRHYICEYPVSDNPLVK